MLHERVDAMFDLERIGTPAGYARMLCVHAAVVPAAEAVLRASPHAAGLPDLQRRFRADALSADLAALEIEPPAALDMSLLISPGGIAGLLYVLEGSRLGARVITRRLAAQAGAALPTGFLNHGEGLGLWPSFLLWLHHQHWNPQDLRDMQSNAIHLFSAYLEAGGRAG